MAIISHFPFQLLNSVSSSFQHSNSNKSTLLLILSKAIMNGLPSSNLNAAQLHSTKCDTKLLNSTDSNANVVPAASTSEDSYENAVRQLNSLQSNAAVLKSIASSSVEKGHLHHQTKNASHAETLEYLRRGGLSLEQLDSLNIVHVAGTKGKGSTCAFVESILRQFGLKTGFFSSPHLVSVRERIRINGQPLTRTEFTKYFFEVYHRLLKNKKHETDMPAYFRFLTCMACYVFHQEKVDVGILEVGIGGSHDSTNIVRKPILVGITSLGLDHQSILGNTLEEITLQKAGIMKQNVPVFTTSTHSPYILKILQQQADETKCPLFVSPPLNQFPYHERIQLGINGHVSEINAALALQLANGFMSRCFPDKLNNSFSSPWEFGTVFEMSQAHMTGLQSCRWDGRFQTFKRRDNLIYYLDGAHTIESLNTTKNWFSDSSPKDSSRILIFHVTGDRDPFDHLQPLSTITPTFDKVIFCPLSVESKKSDNWSALRADGNSITKSRLQADNWSKLVGHDKNCLIFNSVPQVTEYLDTLASDGITNYNVLITGSLHLVGSFLSVLNS